MSKVKTYTDIWGFDQLSEPHQDIVKSKLESLFGVKVSFQQEVGSKRKKTMDCDEGTDEDEPVEEFEKREFCERIMTYITETVLADNDCVTKVFEQNTISSKLLRLRTQLREKDAEVRQLTTQLHVKDERIRFLEDKLLKIGRDASL